MKKFIILISILALAGCRQDKAAESPYVEAFELHLSYNILGVDVAFSSPLKISLVNNTEQFVYRNIMTDTWGRVMLENLLPGEYTVSVSGTLTAEEVALVTGNPADGPASIGGFAASVNLLAGGGNSIDNLDLFIIEGKALIFKELYYAGSTAPNNVNYRNDNFFSVHNNSLEAVSINNLYIGFIENFGSLNASGPLWDGEVHGDYKNVYIQNAWKIVAGDDPVFLASGETIVIASMAAPHNTAFYNPLCPVDLSTADYEAYCIDPENPYPDFDAANMKLAFWPHYSYLWRMGVFGQGIVLIEATEEEMSAFEEVTPDHTFWDPLEDERYWICKKVPLGYISDAVDLIQNEETTLAKRFPPRLDAGYATCSSTYASKSVIRKVKETVGDVVIYQDTNNSTEDFEINISPLTK